jgi:deoxyxylulose-5-phosphate synthase
MALLDPIDSPEDLKKLGLPVLKALAAEIREKIIAVVGRNGGDLSSNLGVVELALAIRRPGAEALIVALGALLRDGSSGGADVHSLRFVAPFDEDFFLDAVSPYVRVLVLEEGAARGGFGEYLVSLIAARLPRVWRQPPASPPSLSPKARETSCSPGQASIRAA